MSTTVSAPTTAAPPRATRRASPRIVKAASSSDALSASKSASSHTAADKPATRRRARVAVEYEHADDDNDVIEVKKELTGDAEEASASASAPPPKKRAKKQPTKKGNTPSEEGNETTTEVATEAAKSSKAPAHWKAVYLGIEEMRLRGDARDAPVDTVGCERLSDKTVEPRVQRFQTLVALMLSAQTKDAVTAQAVVNLNVHFLERQKDASQSAPASSAAAPSAPPSKFSGLTVGNILATDVATIDKLICKVGFHQRKAEYIKKTAAILHEKYADDIPATLEELIALPGVGPKMAHLTMQCAWKNVVGIGVDTHVHRISNRLGWVKTAAQTPEHTRKALEEWLPRDYWGAINALLVGFGQKVCLPIGPKCRICRVNALCPEGRKNLRYVKDENKFFPIPPEHTVGKLHKIDEAIAAKSLEDDPTARAEERMQREEAALLEEANAAVAATSSTLDVTNASMSPAPPAATVQPAAAAADAGDSSSASAAPSPPVVTSRFFPITVKTEPAEPTVKQEPLDEPMHTPATPAISIKQEPM